MLNLNFQNGQAPALNARNMNAIVESINTLGYAVGRPNVASTVSEMTDTSKVYVYTGSETGYTAGNWYYYNGSAWVSGGVYQATAVETDTTLTMSGVAADAKATGDAIADLKSALNIVNDSLDFMAMETYVPEYSIALGNTNAKTLAESVYLQPGNYILTYTQEQTLTSNIRNTPWYAPMGGTKQYQSSSTNNNLSSGVYNWNITIASAGNYDFGLWVNTPSSAVDFKDFYLHKTDTKTEVARIKGDISTLDEYTKGIYQSIVITGNASTNIIKPFYVKAGDVITVYNNGTAIASAYTCSEDGTTIETISSSIGANGGKASITATHNTNYIKLWSSAILNVRCENEDSVINSLKDKDEALDGVAKLVTNDVTVNELKSGNLYYRYAFKAGYKYRVTNNSETTCSLATCNASNTVIDLVSTGLPYGKYEEFVATGDAVSLRIWSSVSEKKVTIESYNTLLYYNNHGISGPY